MCVDVGEGRIGDIEGRFQGLDIAFVRSLRDGEKKGGVGDGAHQRPEMGQRVEQAGQDGERNAAKARFQSDDAAE